VNRTEKETRIESLRDGFRSAHNAFLVGFSGLKVSQVEALRRKVRTTSSSYRVVQNRLAIRATAGTPLEALASRFTGSTAVVWNATDPVSLAKVLTEFAKEHPALLLRAAVVEGRQVVEGDGLQALAKLPGLAGLRSQILGLLQSPATRLVRLIGTPGGQIARVVDARRGQLAGQTE
jgi:large subunit ribosomal protein L10